MNNNVLEFFLKMKDLASSGLAKFAQNAKGALSQVEAMTDRVIRKNQQLGDSVDGVSNKMNKASVSMGGFLSKAMAFVGIAGALSFGTGAIQSAMQFGATQQSFQVLTGSKDAGMAMSNDLNKLSQDTILGPEVFKNAQTMLGFGMAADKVLPTLKMLGDVSMGDANKLGSLTLAFSQVQAAGRLTGQDLLQFINAGFNPLNEISKKTGLSMGELKKQMEQGAITSQMVADAFAAATGEGGLYNGMLDKMAQTDYGRMQMLMGQFEALKIKVGSALMPIATAFMNVATFLMDHIEIVGAVGAAWLTYTVITNAATVAQNLLNAAMKANWIAIIISAVVALIAWVYSMVKTNENWKTSILAIWEVMKAFGRLAWLPFRQFGENAWYYVNLLWLKIKDFAQSIQGTFEKVGRAWELAKSGEFGAAKDALTAEVTTQASRDIAALEQQHAANQRKFQVEYMDNARKISENWDKVKFSGGAKSNSVSASGVPNAGAGAGAGGSMAGLGKGDKVASSITGGGPRVININGLKFADSLHIEGGTMDAAMSMLETKLKEMFLRVVQSGAAVQ